MKIQKEAKISFNSYVTENNILKGKLTNQILSYYFLLLDVDRNFVRKTDVNDNGKFIMKTKIVFSFKKIDLNWQHSHYVCFITIVSWHLFFFSSPTKVNYLTHHIKMIIICPILRNVLFTLVHNILYWYIKIL